MVGTLIVSYRRIKGVKQTAFNVISSYIIALGIAYLTGDFILNNIPEDFITLSIAIICFSSEKIVGYMLYTFNVEEWLKSFFNFLMTKKNKY